jgi:hypothetical protein
MINYKNTISFKKFKYFLSKKNLSFLVKDFKKEYIDINYPFKKKTPYTPNFLQLYTLYKLITLNKRLTIVEFGSGYSTLFFYLALNENKKNYQNKISHFRNNNPFELFVLENIKQYENITKNRLKKIKTINSIKSKITFLNTSAQMTSFNGMLCTEYKKLPLCNPDFIYIDGPSQFSIKNRINNFSTAHNDIVPIGCDILKIEYFLLPGTIIVVDGRVANVRFLKDQLKRKWVYINNKKIDMHIFYLKESPLGKLNKKQLEFYKK